MIRLFVALELPEDVRGSLARLCSGLPGARWVPPENLHLTLRFIGEVDQGFAEDIDAALGTVKTPAFDLFLEGVGHFGKGRAARTLWVGVGSSETLVRLQAKIETALLGAGVAPETRKFTPHVTLARLKAPPRGKLESYLLAHDAFRTRPFAVTRFALFSSFLSSSGAIYTLEAAYPLTR